MHQRITNLRHLLLTLGLVAAQACSQRPAELPALKAAASTSLSISEAQGWYLQTTPAARLAAGAAPARRATADAPGATSARLLWQRAHTLGQGRQQVVLVPFAGDAGLFARTPYVGLRCLVVGKPTGSTLAGNIIEVLLRRTPAPVDTLGLLTRLYHSYQGGGLVAPGQGEGYVLVYSAGYAYLTGRRFAQGQWLPGTTRLAFQPRAGAATKGGSRAAGAGQRAPSVGEPCLDWYSGETGKYITTTGDCNGLGSGGGDAAPVYTGGGGPCGGSCGGAPGPGGYGGGGGGNSNDTSADGISTVAVAIQGGIVDPKQETKCFISTQGAILTVYVQQAKQGTRNKVGPAQVGHTFIGIEQNGIARYIGYYPQSTANTALVGVGVSYPGELHDNSGSPYDVSITSIVNSEQLNLIISYINNCPKIYNLNSYNCADFGIAVGNLGNMKLPTTTTRVALFDGRSPGDLGEDIRAMSNAPSNGSINKIGGNAPVKKGSCP